MPDIVLWNNGLHDVGHDSGRNPVQIPLEMYCANLKFILDRLTDLSPKVIWATTTPVDPDRPEYDAGWIWRNREIDRYNSATRDLMESRDEINNLHALVLDRWPNTRSPGTSISPPLARVPAPEQLQTPSAAVGPGNLGRPSRNPRCRFCSELRVG